MTGKGTTTTMTANSSSSSSSSLSQISSTNGGEGVGVGTQQTNNKSLKNHQKKQPNVRLPAISLLSHTTSSSSSQPQLSKTSRNHHHNSKTVIDITNLYKQSPTILFVKEKYKVYLDWLARNYAAPESPHHSHHLAWYDFEKSLDKTGTHPHPTYNVNTHFQQLRTHHHTYPQNGQQHQTLESLDSSVAAHNQRLLANVLSTLRNNREFGCEDRRLDLESIRRCQPVMKEPQKQPSNKKRTPNKLEPIHSDDLSTPNKSSSELGTSSTKSPNSNNNNKSNSLTSTSLPNRVQFITQIREKNPTTNSLTTTTSSSSNSVYPSYYSSMNPTPPILKPILKNSQSTNLTRKTSNGSCRGSGGGGGGDYLHLVYLDRNNLTNNKRKISSTGSADEHGSTSSSSSMYANDHSKSILPPILPGGPCSEDFYAVLCDMEKSPKYD